MTEVEWLACDQPHQMRDYLVRYNHESGTVAGKRMGFRTSHRKMRLVAVAMLRAVWAGLTAPESRPAAERLERIADGLEQPLEDMNFTSSDSMSILHDEMFWVLNNASISALNLGATRASQAGLFREIVGNPFLPDVPIPPRILTPEVQSLALAAYSERLRKKCRACRGEGERFAIGSPGRRTGGVPCGDCGGSGRIETGELDPVRLMVLADALEEQGLADVDCHKCGGHGWTGKIRLVSESRNRTKSCDCVRGVRPHPVLAHLRSAGSHWRGCAALDRVLGRS